MMDAALLTYAGFGLWWGLSIAHGRGKAKAQNDFRFVLGKTVMEMAQEVKSKRAWVGTDGEMLVYKTATVSSPELGDFKVRVDA